jgi:hypothetical protein
MGFNTLSEAAAYAESETLRVEREVRKILANARLTLARRLAIEGMHNAIVEICISPATNGLPRNMASGRAGVKQLLRRADEAIPSTLKR